MAETSPRPHSTENLLQLTVTSDLALVVTGCGDKFSVTHMCHTTYLVRQHSYTEKKTCVFQGGKEAVGSFCLTKMCFLRTCF